MWEQIRNFFRIIFGLDQGNESGPISSPGPQAEAERLIEDASDLGEASPVIISVQEAETSHLRSRGGIGGEEVRKEYQLDATISITTPRFLWCLDNGHGKLQNGKRSPRFDDGTQFEEWEFNRDVVRRMAKKLDQIGIQYYITVPEDEVGSFLKERVGRANEKSSLLGLPKIFLSIHANALGMSDWVNGTKGIEVWHFPGNDTGQRLASAFQASLMEHLPNWRDRGLKSHQRGSSKIFYVLRKTSMPAVLTENGFYTDKAEATLLMTPEVRQTIADAHVAAIVKIERDGYEAIPVYRPNMVLA